MYKTSMFTENDSGLAVYPGYGNTAADTGQ